MGLVKVSSMFLRIFLLGLDLDSGVFQDECPSGITFGNSLLES